MGSAVTAGPGEPIRSAPLPRLIGDRDSRTRRRRLGGVARRLLTLSVALAALAGTAPGIARADGDPASDTLISQNVFYPYSSLVSQAAQTRLDAEVAVAHRAGIDLRIAVIARAADLGSVTGAYRRPRFYARFLDTEISYGRRIPLLVVMPDGYGAQGLPAAFTRRVLAAPPPAGASGTALARALTSALAGALAPAGHAAKAAGHHGRSGSGRIELLLILSLAAVLVAGALIVMRVFFPASRSQVPGGKA